MSRPKLLDLFCGAGGAAMGYHRAGFDVVGVDLEPQKHYPFEFIQADATTFPLDGFDAIHASPPCQDHMKTPHRKHGTGWMLDHTRRRLQAQPKPWVIENVPGAEMRADYVLCGCMFGLPNLRRERWFETSWHGFDLNLCHDHSLPAISVVGHGTPTWVRQKLGRNPTIAEYRAAMGIDWMNRDELSQAIPPAYTEHIGGYLLEAVTARALLHLRRPPPVLQLQAGQRDRVHRAAPGAPLRAALLAAARGIPRGESEAQGRHDRRRARPAAAARPRPCQVASSSLARRAGGRRRRLARAASRRRARRCGGVSSTHHIAPPHIHPARNITPPIVPHTAARARSASQ